MKRSCKSDWFGKWKWLHYCENDDHVLCYVCVCAVKPNKMTVGRGDAAFITKGFSNWKDGTIAFKKHEASSCHRQALQVTVVIPLSCPDVGAILSRQYAVETKNNRRCFLKVLAVDRYLARQGIAFRGDGDDSDYNFIQLLKLQASQDQILVNWLSQKTNKYTSHDSQNEVLQPFCAEKSGCQNLRCIILHNYV